jgi:hypothetical protein
VTGAAGTPHPGGRRGCGSIARLTSIDGKRVTRKASGAVGNIPRPVYADDPRHPLLRPSLLDPVRKPLAVCMLCGAAIIGAHALCNGILHDTRGAADVPSLGAPLPPPMHLSVQAPPSGGTAIAPGYYSAPPYDPVDPDPPEPLIFRID